MYIDIVTHESSPKYHVILKIVITNGIQKKHLNLDGLFKTAHKKKRKALENKSVPTNPKFIIGSAKKSPPPNVV